MSTFSSSVRFHLSDTDIYCLTATASGVPLRESVLFCQSESGLSAEAAQQRVKDFLSEKILQSLRGTTTFAGRKHTNSDMPSPEKLKPLADTISAVYLDVCGADSNEGSVHRRGPDILPC